MPRHTLFLDRVFLCSKFFWYGRQSRDKDGQLVEYVRAEIFERETAKLKAEIERLKYDAPKRESVALTHEQVKAQGFCTPGFPCNYCMGLLKPTNRTEDQL